MEEDLYVSHYAALLRRTWAVVLGFTVAGALIGAVLVLFILPRQYRSAASVLFESSSGGSGFALPAYIPGLSTIARQFSLGSQCPNSSMIALALGDSQTVRLEVVDRLDLVRQFEAAGKYDAEHRLAEMSTVHMTDKGTMAVQVAISGTPRGVLPKPDDDLEQRTLARDIANEYVDVIRDKLDSLTLTRSQRKAEFLRERVEQSREELDEARQALAQGQGEVAYVAPIPSVPPEISTLATYEKERAMAGAEEAAAAEALAQLESQLDDEELMVLSNVVSQRSSVADRLREDVAEAQAQLAALHDKGYNDEHPECRELLVRIETLEANYSNEIDEGLRNQSETLSSNPVRAALRTRISQLQGELAAAAASRQEMEGQVGQLQSRIAALPSAMERVAALQQELEVKAAVYGVVTNAYEMARAEAEENAPQFTVLDDAIIPPRKVAPSGTRTCLATGFLGLLIGLMVASSLRRGRPGEPAPSGEAEAPGDTGPGAER